MEPKSSTNLFELATKIVEKSSNKRRRLSDDEKEENKNEGVEIVKTFELSAEHTTRPLYIHENQRTCAGGVPIEYNIFTRGWELVGDMKQLHPNAKVCQRCENVFESMNIDECSMCKDKCCIGEGLCMEWTVVTFSKDRKKDVLICRQCTTVLHEQLFKNYGNSNSSREKGVKQYSFEEK